MLGIHFEVTKSTSTDLVQGHEPSRFTMAALQMLANRDACTSRGRVIATRRLLPQLLDNFVDLEAWAREFFRVHVGNVAHDVPLQ